MDADTPKRTLQSLSSLFASPHWEWMLSSDSFHIGIRFSLFQPRKYAYGSRSCLLSEQNNRYTPMCGPARKALRRAAATARASSSVVVSTKAAAATLLSGPRSGCSAYDTAGALGRVSVHSSVLSASSRDAIVRSCGSSELSGFESKRTLTANAPRSIPQRTAWVRSARVALVNIPDMIRRVSSVGFSTRAT